MDAALFVSDESKSQLDAGVAIKLRAAGTARLSQVPLPTEREGITGVKWKRLARDAELTAAEMGYLHDWLEANYGEVVAERFTRPLPVISNDVNVTSGPQVSGDEVTSSMSKLKIASMVGAGSAETTFQKLFKEGQPGVNSLFEEQEGANPSAEIAVSATERADVLAHGFSSGMIATLTWFLHTARPPPINSSDFCYGVDPSSVRKLYSGMQSSVGTLLWELVKSNTSTMRDFQDHFYRATQASSDYPAVRQRLSNHWIEMTQYFDDARLVRSYYKKFLTIRSGRGLPKLVDEHILMLVMCAEMEKGRGEGASGGDLRAEMSALVSTVEKQTRIVESSKETISELKLKLGEVKNDLNNMKNDVKVLKEKVSKPKAPNLQDRECTYCGMKGHTEAYCHKKEQDAAAKKGKAEE